jgi:hypothetical protein
LESDALLAACCRIVCTQEDDIGNTLLTAAEAQKRLDTLLLPQMGFVGGLASSSDMSTDAAHARMSGVTGTLSYGASASSASSSSSTTNRDSMKL